MSENSRHIACTGCRERKVRCDGARPICKRCTRCGIECVYKRRRQAKGDPLVPSTNANDPFGLFPLCETARGVLLTLQTVQTGAPLASPNISSSTALPRMTPSKSCDNIGAALLSGMIPVHSALPREVSDSLMLLYDVLPFTAADDFHDAMVTDSLPTNNPAEYAAPDIFEMDTVGIPGAVEPLNIGTVDMLDQEHSNEAQNELWPSIESSSLSESTRLSSVERQTSDGSEVQSLTLMHDLYVPNHNPTMFGLGKWCL